MRQFCSHLGSKWLVVGLSLALLLTACGRRQGAEVEPNAYTHFGSHRRSEPGRYPNPAPDGNFNPYLDGNPNANSHPDRHARSADRHPHSPPPLDD